MARPKDLQDPAASLDSTTSTVGAPEMHSGDRHGYLLTISGLELGRLFRLQEGRALVAGRADGVDIHIADEGISRQHFSIQLSGSQAVVRDLKSHNGTFVNGARERERIVEHGDLIQIGVHTALKFTFARQFEADHQGRLAEAAGRDPLTGTYNRRHFEERLAAEFSAARRHNRALSLLLIDIDHFKSINDKHGHVAGDNALRMVSGVIQAQLRREDVLARYGGEEFVVLAREASRTGARILAERIRDRIEQSVLSWKGRELKVTVSVGLSVTVGLSQVASLTEKELVAAADRGLYRAKSQGRNRVVEAPFLPHG